MKSLLLAGLLLPIPSALMAATIQVTVTASGPVGLAPAYATFHDGSFDFFDPGSMASTALENLAEVGDTSGYTHPNGMTMAPGGPFVPNGGSTSALFDVANADSFFSVAAMVLPSNDWFVGTGAGVDISSLLSGAPVGTSLTIDLTTIWDAGTELEDFAFAPGGPLVGITTAANPGGGADQNALVNAVMGADPFSSFANLEPAGFDTSALDPAGGPVASIRLEVIPEPSSAVLLTSALLVAVGVRRRRG